MLPQNLVPLPNPHTTNDSLELYKEDICKQHFHQGALINHNFYGNFCRHIALKFEKVGPAFSSVITRPTLPFIDIDNRVN